VTHDTHPRVLSVIVCGAGPATAIGTFVQLVTGLLLQFAPGRLSRFLVLIDQAARQFPPPPVLHEPVPPQQ